ncbi:MAG: CAP domain-containing protein [Cyclobacteriaceae bacterium]
MKSFLSYSIFVCFFSITSLCQYQSIRLDPNDYFTSTEINSANTALGVDYLTKEEQDIYLYSNLARAYPLKFYNFYRAFAIAEGKSSDLTRNSYFTSLTKELKTMKPVGIMYPDREMYELARCWADESGEKGLIGHDREECPKGYSGENCAYGYDTGLEIVVKLLIDEGVKDLGHRINLLYPDWKGMGAAISEHKDYRFCAVQNFARTNDDLRKQDELRRLEEEKEKKERDRLLAERQQEFETAMAGWDVTEIQKADAARSFNYLNDLEKDLYFYSNLIRLNPKKFKEVIWDKGPFFDQLVSELETGFHTENDYKSIANWLQTASAKRAFTPKENHIAALRCVIDRYLSGKENYRACFKFTGAWRFQTFYSQSNYNDVMNILSNYKDFNDLIVNGATMAVHPGEPSIKVFVTPN